MKAQEKLARDAKRAEAAAARATAKVEALRAKAEQLQAEVDAQKALVAKVAAEKGVEVSPS